MMMRTVKPEARKVLTLRGEARRKGVVGEARKARREGK
jgi:hypothetical protein